MISGVDLSCFIWLPFVFWANCAECNLKGTYKQTLLSHTKDEWSPANCPSWSNVYILWASKFLPSTRLKPNFQTSKRWNLLVESAFVRRYKKSICGRKVFLHSTRCKYYFSLRKVENTFHTVYLSARQHYIINEFLINTEDRVGHLLTCNCYNFTDL